jgi:hypothetical protein
MPTLVIIQILEKSSLKQKEKASHEKWQHTAVFSPFEGSSWKLAN